MQYDQMSQGLKSQSVANNIRAILASPNDSALYNEVRQLTYGMDLIPTSLWERAESPTLIWRLFWQTVEMLQAEQTRRQVEFYTLVDANMRVIASANPGQVRDPA